MQLTKDDAQPDERIGSDPRPKSEREMLIEQIIEHQRSIYALEKKLNELDQQSAEIFSRPPNR